MRFQDSVFFFWFFYCGLIELGLIEFFLKLGFVVLIELGLIDSLAKQVSKGQLSSGLVKLGFLKNGFESKSCGVVLEIEDDRRCHV